MGILCVQAADDSAAFFWAEVLCYVQSPKNLHFLPILIKY